MSDGPNYGDINLAWGVLLSTLLALAAYIVFTIDDINQGIRIRWSRIAGIAGSLALLILAIYSLWGTR